MLCTKKICADLPRAVRASHDGGEILIEKTKGNIIPDLIPGTPVGISIYSVTQEAPHHHEGFMEIIYCFKGPVKISARSLDILLEDGDIMSCDPFDVHYIEAAATDKANVGNVKDAGTDDIQNLLVSFYFDLQNPIFDKQDLDKLYFICEPSAIPDSKQENLAELKRLLLTLLYFYCFPHPKLPRAETAVRFSKKIIQMMLDHFHYFYFNANSTEYSDEMKSLYESIIVYIEKNYASKITLESLCETQHYNYKYLSHFFKKTSAVGFAKFLNNIRAYKATFHLLASNKNISEISYEVGFSAPMYFYKVFKMWNGTTPHQYRKKLRELAAAADENTYYDIITVKEELEHFISFHFAQLQVPELWLTPYMPFKGVPSEQA